MLDLFLFIEVAWPYYILLEQEVIQYYSVNTWIFQQQTILRKKYGHKGGGVWKTKYHNILKFNFGKQNYQ